MQFGTEAKKYNDPEDMAAAYLVRYFGNQKMEITRFLPIV